MRTHGSEENGINLDDDFVPYEQVETALSEAVAGYAHLYNYGITKCNFLSDLLILPVLNLEDFGCHNHHELKPGYSCILPCHSFCDISCATRNAHSFYKWLINHFQTKSYVVSIRYDKLYLHVCSSRIKRQRPNTYHSVYLAMSAR